LIINVDDEGRFYAYRNISAIVHRAISIAEKSVILIRRLILPFQRLVVFQEQSSS
jgi:hypothetical protein